MSHISHIFCIFLILLLQFNEFLHVTLFILSLQYNEYFHVKLLKDIFHIFLIIYKYKLYINIYRPQNQQNQKNQ